MFRSLPDSRYVRGNSRLQADQRPDTPHLVGAGNHRQPVDAIRVTAGRSDFYRHAGRRRRCQDWPDHDRRDRRPRQVAGESGLIFATVVTGGSE